MLFLLFSAANVLHFSLIGVFAIIKNLKGNIVH